MSFQDSVREQMPVLVSVAGRSGSGKTMSSLLMARGLAGPEGTIGVIDTENKRSAAFSDHPEIGGFKRLDLYPPFTADAYIAAIKEADKAAIDVLVIDSGSHEWTGIGGAIEQADAIQARMKKPGPTAWIKPKMAHRRFVNSMLQAQCHVIVCLRADYKLVATKDEEGKQVFAESDHLIPEQEKKFIYEMTISATLDHDTHMPMFTKVPDALRGALLSDRLIGLDTGETIRKWVDGGKPVDKEVEQAMAVLRDVAGQWGSEGMRAEYGRMAGPLKSRLAVHLDELRQIAAEADKVNAAAEAEQPIEDEEGPGL